MDESSPDDTNRSARVERRRLLQTAGGISALALAGCLGGDDDDDANGDDSNGDDPTGNGADVPWEDYEAPDETPERVDPGAEPFAAGAEPPADATVLWDGETVTLDDWEHTDGRDAEWIEHDDYFEVELGTGDIQSREELGDCHLHVEWRVPEEYEGFVDIEEGGDGQGPGNSGVFLMNTYEVQVLQSHDNPTYPGGYAGAYYYAAPGEAGVPLVLPTNPPGEWNVYDIVWRGPRFDGDDVERYPQLTVFFNGVAVLNHFDVPSPTSFDNLMEFQDAHPQDGDGNFLEAAPLQLQDHSVDYDEVHFKNIWYRDLPESPVEIDSPDEMPEHASDRNIWEEREEWNGRHDSYDPDHPDQPEQIEPGAGTGDAPEDADILIDGEMSLAPGDGDWESGEDYGDCQVHLEWQVDADAEAEGPWRGDSGLQIGDYEIQLLDTYDNPVEAEEWAGAYTGQEGPDWDAVRESGEWQQLDVIFQGPDGDQSAQVTAFLNGVIVQTRLMIDESNLDADHDDMEIRLQEPREDGSEVSVRNTWARSLIYDDD